MKPKALILLVVAGGCGLVAVLGVQQLMGKEDDSPKARILVALEDINTGVRPNETNTVFKDVDPENVPEGAITSLEEIGNLFLKYPAVAGDIIFQSKLTDDANLSGTLKKGERIATVSVNQTTNHSGLMRPGDRVDMILTFKSVGIDRKSVRSARTILQYLEIVAVGSIRPNDTNKEEIPEINAKNVSLKVTEKQARTIELAKTVGQITLSIRSKDDSEKLVSETITEAMLRGEPVFVNAENGSDTNNTNDETGLFPKLPQNNKGKKVEKKKGWEITIYTKGTPTVYEVSLRNESKNDKASKKSKST